MTIQRTVFRLMQKEHLPRTVGDVAMVANLPEKSVRDAFNALHKKDLAFPVRLHGRGQAWIVDKQAQPPMDLRGRVTESLQALSTGRAQRLRWMRGD